MPRFLFIGGKNPGSQTYTSGSGTFSVPYYAENLRVRIWGAGGGGAGMNNTAGVAGSAGGTTTFDVMTTTGGGGSGLPSGGVASGGDININGNGSSLFGGEGAAAPEISLGGGAQQPLPTGNSTQNGVAGNPYGGGGTSAKYWDGSNIWTARGGGSGAFSEKIYTPSTLSPGASVSYAVGTGGAGGDGSSSDGGSGANGAVVIEWDY